MSSAEEALELLELWKARPFHAYDINLADAAASVKTDKPMVQYRPYGNPPWSKALDKWTVRAYVLQTNIFAIY